MKQVVVGIISQMNKSGEVGYLLVSSDKASFGVHSGAYYPPGGHIESGESEEQALIREIKEELQLDIEPIAKIAETPGDVPNQVTHWWGCRILGGQMAIQSEELSDARFFIEQQMKSMRLWPATRQFFQEYIFNR